MGSSIYHQISIVNPASTETNNQMPDGTVYYAMPQVSVHVIFVASDSAYIGGCDRVPT